tara:strand:- start:17754 stop:20453 length:2700 start_codon:yes stop_codon:yes gene_type:complete
MALGDGIRRNIAHVSDVERDRFINAVVQLNSRYYADGVSKWVKQDQIHEATHVHGGPSFLPWHRELLNRYEQLLREIDPDLSLHYWDWTEDPRAAANVSGGTYNIFTTSFMGESNGNVGAPFAGFPPISRDVAGGAAAPSHPSVESDTTILDSSDGFPQSEQWHEFRLRLEGSPNHNSIHGYIGGTIGPAHTAFEDPFVFVMHANIDRLWARWQTEVGEEWRLDPLFTYGNETNDPSIVENLEPWAGGSGLRPWAAPDNQQEVKNYKHISVVIPPCYDTNLNNEPIVEVDNVGTPPLINFNDIPEGDTAARAAVFNIFGCAEATIRVKPGSEPSSPFSILHPISGSITVAHEPVAFKIGRIWLAFTAGAAGVAVPDGSVTFECIENGQEFTFTLKANAIERPTVAVILALDQSGSMNDPAGNLGNTRIEVLKDAARTFAEIIPQQNGLGLIRFDSNAYPVNHATFPGLKVTKINSDSMLDANRIMAINAVTSHATNPGARTSVGDGVQLARDVLAPIPLSEYQQKAIIVFTDGLENEPVDIADVTGAIDNQTFAIGLGNESQVNTSALTALANSTEGYLLLTGLLSANIDDYFRLTKYFLQILAGVTNNNIILDPNGYIAPGTTISIPFYVNEADIDGTVILLTDYPVVDIILETPGGDLINSGNAAGLGISYGEGSKSKNYKFTMPVAFPANNHGGKWIAHLKVDKDDFKKYVSILRDTKNNDPNAIQSFVTHGARYSLVVNTYSNLKMEAAIYQDSLEPGSEMVLRATLNEYGQPVENRAVINVEVKRPDNTQFILQLDEIEAGVFEKSFPAQISGTYFCRFVARGATLRGTAFTREQTFTGAVFRGGDNPTNGGNTGTDDPSSIGELIEKCCKNLTRILIAILILLVIFIILYLRR